MNSDSPFITDVVTASLETDTPTDTSNAQAVLNKLAGRAMYCKSAKQWYLADDSERWSKDRTNRISKRTQDVMIQLWHDVAANPDPRDPRVRHRLKSLDAPAIERCLRILEFQQRIAILPEQLDSDPMLLGVENGILDLRTRELLKPKLDLLVTKCAPVRFKPSATCERFRTYLERVQPDEEVRRFLQRLTGACLTGLQPEQSFIFFLGSGANGKSVFLRVLHDILGVDYAFKARKSLVFMPDKRSGENAAGPNDIADLDGRRLITTTEQAGRRWNLSFIKEFTGGESMHGRQLYLSGRMVRPVGKILIAANVEPFLDEFDEAIRRRFILVPWPVTIPEPERVTPLEHYVSHLLEGESSGVLNWALDGLADLIERNWRLDPPVTTREATAEYLSEQDQVSRFIDDWCELDPQAVTSTSELRKYFIAWSGEPERFAVSSKKFTQECIRIFGRSHCHQGRGRTYFVSGLKLSDRGKSEYAERDLERFRNGDL